MIAAQSGKDGGSGTYFTPTGLSLIATASLGFSTVWAAAKERREAATTAENFIFDDLSWFD
jgi:hypothetical protein